MRLVHMSTREYYSMQAATFSLLSVLCYYTTELLGGHIYLLLNILMSVLASGKL